MTRPVALVTGPTSGIGREFALELARRGHDLVLVARDRQRLEALAAELASYGAHAEIIRADLADRAQHAVVEARISAGIDLLVNNAGFGHTGSFLDLTVEDEVAMLDVLVTAVLRFTHTALTQMVARGAGGIINVSSVAGEVPGGPYSSAKSYVTRLSEWADLTYRDRGVRTMALLPGFTRTEFHQRMGVNRPRPPRWMWLTTTQVVDAALDDFARGRTVSTPSLRYKALVAAARHTPTPLRRTLQRRWG